MDGDRQTPLDGVTGTMTYLVPTDKKPVAYQYEPPPGIRFRLGQRRTPTASPPNLDGAAPDHDV